MRGIDPALDQREPRSLWNPTFGNRRPRSKLTGFSLKNKYLGKAGPKALPPLIRIIDEYQPSHQKRLSVAGERFDSARMILEWFDTSVFRLRAFAEGRMAIQTLKNARERMQIAGFADQAKDKEFAKQSRYKLTIMAIKDFEGINEVADFPDRSVNDTLRVKYGVSLSDSELKDFTEYLIARDPFYPSWGKREFQRQDEKVIFIINPSAPFYQAYLDFKARR